MKYAVEFENGDFGHFNEEYSGSIDSYGVEKDEADLLTLEEAKRIVRILKSSGENGVFLWNKNERTAVKRVVEASVLIGAEVHVTDKDILNLYHVEVEGRAKARIYAKNEEDARSVAFGSFYFPDDKIKVELLKEGAEAIRGFAPEEE